VKRPLSPSETAPELATERLRLRSIAIAAVVLLGVLYLNLLSALFAGLTGFVLYRRIRDFTGPAQGSWMARTLRWLMVSVAVAGLVLLFALGTELLFKSGGLARLMQLIADTLDQLRATAPPWVVARLPESADAVQHAMSRWLREHSGEMQRWGAEALKVLVHILLGLAIGLMAAMAARNLDTTQVRRPLIVLAQARMLQLANAFGDVFSAQLRISLINAVLTAIYLLVLLPALGYRIPLAPTLVGFTFFGGLVPIVGNLLSNTAITIAALTVSVWLGVASLVFLVVIHKLEYFLNAKIVGGRTNVPTYAMLGSMLLLESAFGIAGLVAAPIFCAWLTRELRDGDWI